MAYWVPYNSGLWAAAQPWAIGPAVQPWPMGDLPDYGQEILWAGVTWVY
jgi:hypothetical protein